MWKPTLFRCNLTFHIDSLLSSSGNYIFQMQFYFLYWSLVHVWLCVHVWFTLLCIYYAFFFFEFWYTFGLLVVYFRVTFGTVFGFNTCLCCILYCIAFHNHHNAHIVFNLHSRGVDSYTRLGILRRIYKIWAHSDIFWSCWWRNMFITGTFLN